jgi:hypothetical protein
MKATSSLPTGAMTTACTSLPCRLQHCRPESSYLGAPATRRAELRAIPDWVAALVLIWVPD